MLADRGVKVVLQAETKRFVPGEEAVTVVTSQGEYAAEAVLVAIGRRPNVEALHLEVAGVQLTPRGFIQTDEYLRATPNIWAMGDVAGSPQFTYVSLDDYRIVRDQILGEGEAYDEGPPATSYQRLYYTYAGTGRDDGDDGSRFGSPL